MSIHTLPGRYSGTSGGALPGWCDRICLHGLAPYGRAAKRRRTGLFRTEEPCIWNKTNGGMGTFYRSKTGLILVVKVGTAQHVNTFGLGETGRYRTNVWNMRASIPFER